MNAVRPRARCAAAACLIVAMWHVAGAAQSSTPFWPRGVGPFITVAWDPSPDPSVIGYVVYVGTESRNYTTAYHVGNRTSFVYPYAAINRRHFFAVAAFSSGFGLGELSNEVSGFGRLVPPPHYVPDLTIPSVGLSGFYPQCASSQGCLEAAPVSASARRISALASSAEGQLWFVEDRYQIFAIDLDGTVRRINRPGRTRGQVDGLAIDPRFAETGYVYVQEIDRFDDRSRELIISRYREVMGTLRERAVVVSGIRLPATGSVPFTVDRNGQIFVAVPRDRNTPRPHDGIVFSVQPDATHVQASSESPTSSRGLSDPSSLVWDSERRELWMSGRDGAGTATVQRLSVNPTPRTALMKNASRYLLVPAPGGQLLRVDRHEGRAEYVRLGSGEIVTAVTDAGHDVVFAATHSHNAVGSRIVAIPLGD